MKKMLGIGLILMVAVSVVAGSMNTLSLTDPEATTNAAIDTSITKGSIGGSLEGIYIYVENEREILASDSVTTDPSVDGLYFDIQSATYNSSNYYVSEDGLYKIRYETTGFTNWALSTVATGLSGPVWTNDAFIATNWQVHGSTATGMVQIAATTTDLDIDITTTASKGSGPARTLFSKDNVTTSAYYPIRIPISSTAGVTTGWTNETAQIPFAGTDGITLDAYAATEENVKVTAIIFFNK